MPYWEGRPGQLFLMYRPSVQSENYSKTTFWQKVAFKKKVYLALSQSEVNCANDLNDLWGVEWGKHFFPGKRMYPHRGNLLCLWFCFLLMACLPLPCLYHVPDFGSLPEPGHRRLIPRRRKDSRVGRGLRFWSHKIQFPVLLQSHTSPEISGEDFTSPGPGL